jgi:hypothetical protein
MAENVWFRRFFTGVCVLILWASLGWGACLRHDIRLKVQTAEHFCSGTDTIHFSGAGGQEVFLLINKDFEISDVRLNSQTVVWKEGRDFTVLYGRLGAGVLEHARRNAKIIAVPVPAGVTETWNITVSYFGRFAERPIAFPMDDELKTFVPGGAISPEQVFLPPQEFWYPRLGNELVPVRLSVEGPEEILFVSRGEKRDEKQAGGLRTTIWETDHPGPAAMLVGAAYRVNSASWRNIQITTYLFPDDDVLATEILETARRLLQEYSDRYGLYPFEKFAVVETPFHASTGMPSYAVLGRSTLRAPSEMETRLAHEMLRNWWGNSVFVDEIRGNWSEGLVTYLADHCRLEQKSAAEAAKLRQQFLRDYVSQVNDVNEYPLQQFFQVKDLISQAIGCGKSAMVFHMLRDYVQSDVFFEILPLFYRERLWQRASWMDIQEYFQRINVEKHEKRLKEILDRLGRIPVAEREKDPTLAWFFNQWVYGEGTPILEAKVKNLFRPLENQFLLAFTLGQSTSNFKLNVPIRIQGENDSENRWITLDQDVKEYQIFSALEPVTLEVDPDFDIFRFVWTEQGRSSLGAVLDSTAVEVLLPLTYDKANAARDFIQDIFRGKEARVLDVGISPSPGQDWLVFLEPWQVRDRQWLQLLGDLISPDTRYLEIMQRRIPLEGQTVCLGLPGTRGDTAVLLVICDSDGYDLATTLEALPEMKDNGYIIFRRGKLIEKGKWPTTRSPLSIDIR